AFCFARSVMRLRSAKADAGLSALLLVVLLLLMSFSFTSKALGIVMGAGVLLHLAWNRGWLAALPRGRWSLGRAIPAAVNLALAVCFLLALVSGLAIANQLFHGLFGMAWQRSIVAHQVHITSSYALLILTGLHLGLHGEALWRRFALWAHLDASSRRVRIVLRRAAILTVALGVYGSFLHRLGDRLLMKHIFGTAATKLPFAVFLLVLLGIVGLYAVIGYLIGRFAKKQE
ncbi:MAG: DUF4405 domain-containing protein, partial [Schwartzia sp.]|nr:DUF4405 domain-containing protein [Schwartzia sp. (in: firmicutes)]